MSHNMNEAKMEVSQEIRSEYAIEVKDLVKAFPGTLALKGINVKFKKGTVIGLLGKNGSGKSTLINVLSGMQPKTSGTILYDGKEAHIKSVGDSEELGFRFISQEPYLMDDLTVAENIAFREKHLKRNFSLIDAKEFDQRAREKLAKINLNVDTQIQAKYLTVSEKQLVLAVREVLSEGAKVIAFDEVANALSQKEIESVFKLIREEKENGVTFIYISHEVDEVFSICDSVVVVRDGEVALVGETKDLTSDQLKRAIVGRDIQNCEEMVPVEDSNKEVVLKVQGLSNSKLKNISFDLAKGEVLGVFGLRGSGRTEFLKTIYGLMHADKGRVEYLGRDITILSVMKRAERGIGFVPEDRFEGCMDCRPIRDNLFMSSMKQNLNRIGLIDRRKENDKYEKIKREFEVKAEGQDSEVAYLSGGNKQKIMFARCRVMNSALYLVDEGTKGIDVGTKYEIYNLMKKLAENGNSFIYTSSDLEEICLVSHRIFVLYNGEIVAELPRQEFTKMKLLYYADGNRD